MLQDIQPNIFINKYENVSEILPEDYILYFEDDKLLLRKNGDEPDIPQKKDLPGILEGSPSTFLFTLNNASCFLLWDSPNPDMQEYLFQEINFFRTFKKKEVAWISVVANQLMNWYVHNKFCGKCGHQTTMVSHERAITCSNCKTTVYPKISPAVIVAITSGDKILLARNKNFRSSFFSLVAGYADIGESLEDTVIREVKEEVGLDVHNIRYYKSQPWPFSGSMMIGYLAEADASQPIQIEEAEIAEAAWFTRGNLPNHPTNISIGGEMIELFEKGLL